MYNQVPNNYSYQSYNNPYGMMNRGDASLMQQQVQAQIPQPQLKGRPVASIDEVRAAQVDFDGSLFVFPNIANQKIFTKQINLDGTVSLNTYVLAKEVEPSPETYVTREEFDNLMTRLRTYFNSQNQTQNVSDQPQDSKPSFVANF